MLTIVKTVITTILKTTMLAALPLLLAGQVHAHGITEPQHGGIVKVSGDVSLELVKGEGTVEIYILDDEPWDTTGMGGKLKVETAEGKSEYKLTPIEGSGLRAEGVTLQSGAKVLAIITKTDGYSKIAGKFDIE